MDNTNEVLVGMLIGRIEVLERALLRAMILILNREPRRVEILKDLEEDFRSFVLSLPMTPEEIQKYAETHSDALIQQISSSLQGSADIHYDSTTIDPDI